MISLITIFAIASFGMCYMLLYKAWGKMLFPERLEAREEELKMFLRHFLKRATLWAVYRMRILRAHGLFVLYKMYARLMHATVTRPTLALAKRGSASVFLKEMVAHKNATRIAREN